ncbi:MAG: nuclease-related domain-containing protein [Wenzhouxiangella sp.]
MADTRFIQDYPAMRRHREQMAASTRARTRRIVFTVAVLAVLIGAAWTVSPPLAFLLAGIGAGVLFFAAMPAPSSVGADELSGVEGEVRVLERLRRLPDDFVIFNRLRVPDRQLPNGSRELDFVLVDEGGISVIEVKNTPGLIYVDPEKRQWPLTRRAGCGSRPSWNALDNPIPQVRAQTAALERWLLEHGISARIRPMICFAHFEVAVENAEDSPVEVITADALGERLVSESPGSGASGPGRERLVKALSGLVSPATTTTSARAA